MQSYVARMTIIEAGPPAFAMPGIMFISLTKKRYVQNVELNLCTVGAITWPSVFAEVQCEGASLARPA